jgi:tyrosine-protein kinase Etk/Wzc
VPRAKCGHLHEELPISDVERLPAYISTPHLFLTTVGSDTVFLDLRPNESPSVEQFPSAPPSMFRLNSRGKSVPTQHQEAIVHSAPASSAFMLTWLRVTINRKKLVGSTAVAIVVLGLAAALLLPNHYTATVVILPPLQTTSTAAAMMAQMGNMGGIASMAGAGLGIKNPNDQQVALLKSRTVEDAMVDRFALRELYRRKYVSTARKQWEKHTEVENGLKDGLIRISVTDSNARRAAEMANGWVEEYQRFTATIAITEAAQRRLFYERELGVARADLAHAEEDMKQTEQRTGMIDIEGQDRSMIATAAVLRGQLAAKQIEIRAMREFAAEQNPDLQRAEQQAAGMEGQLAAMDAASDRKTGDLIAPKGTVTQSGLDYARSLREVKYRETVQDLLMRQYEGARVDEARQGALIQVVDPSIVPDRPTRYRLWVALVTVLMALPLALLTAQAAEAVANLRRVHLSFGSWDATLEEFWRAHSQ